jgi:hypothetical protein
MAKEQWDHKLEPTAIRAYLIGYMPTSRQYWLYDPVREQIVISTAPTFVEGKRLDWDRKETLVGQVVTLFDLIEEPEAVVEIGNSSDNNIADEAARPEIKPAAGQNLEGGDPEDDHDQQNDQDSITEQDQELGGSAEPEEEGFVDPEPEEDRAAPPPEAPRAVGS